jgi:YD repeat-containing protein
MRTDKEKQGLRGPIKSVQIETAQFESQDGQLVERPWFGHTLSFNRDGWLTEQTNRNPDGSEWRTVSDYSESGKLLATRNYDPSGALVGEIRVVYDDKGRPVAEQYITQKGSVSTPTTYVYDGAGRKIKIQELDYPGEVNLLIGIEGTNSSIGADGAKRIETRYDERDEAVEVKIFNADGVLISRMEVVRDEHGNPLAETQYAGETVSFNPCASGACSTEALAELTEEQRAEIEAEIARLFASGTAMSTHIHSYDARGRLIESKLTMMGMEAGHQRFAYDEDGNKIEELIYNDDGTLANKVIFTRDYDQHGNWIKELVSTASSWDAEFNLSSPVNVTRRTISYYE